MFTALAQSRQGNLRFHGFVVGFLATQFTPEINPIGCEWDERYIYLHECLKSMLHVGEYSIHGASGNGLLTPLTLNIPERKTSRMFVFVKKKCVVGSVLFFGESL